MRKALICLNLGLVGLGALTLAAPVRAELSDIPEIVICQPDPLEIRRTWKVVSFPTPDSVVAACRNICAGGWTGCIAQAYKTDDLGQPLHRLLFTVDGLPGGLRWNQAHPDLGVTKSVLLFSGGGGTTLLDDNIFWRRFDDDGVRVIALRWHSAIPNPETGSGFGFLSDNDGDPSTLWERVLRPAAVMQWAHDNLSEGTTFGTVGTSGGAVASFAPVYWHGLDPIVDYQLFLGGPAAWDLTSACEGRSGTYGPGIAPPFCENDPSIICAVDADCGGDHKCAYPNRAKNFALVDYIHRTGRTCADGLSDPSFDDSSYRFVSGDWDFDHPVDIKIQEGDDPERDDTLRGGTYAAGNIFLNLTSPNKTYEDLEGWNHGSVIGDPAFRDFLECVVSNGLGLASTSCTAPSAELAMPLRPLNPSM